VTKLGERVAPPGELSADGILDRFLAWTGEQGLLPYAEQEEAILELLADRHVVLSTPTGSGKSLVALALHFRALCEGRRSFYTAPVKALVSEKFFALCDELGAERVGMLTGDASINPDAPVVCCTTEVLANMALAGGEQTDAPFVVLDEFHYYDDRDRGMAWQIPLIVLRNTRFLLLSATLGNTDPIERRLADFTGRRVAHVHSDERPVPLDFEYRETPLHETLEDLVERDLAPVYVVNFTQRECGDLAQGATSAALASRERRDAIAEAVGGFRFDSAYGRDLKRFLSHGVAVHHAGLLPKYRLLVERLAQEGLLVAIFGTDTLGVGVNVPIRTVVLNRLSKFDGEKVGILRVREFQQIAGRAGRKGFDDRGTVVCQAPEHVVENKRQEEKARRAGGKRKLQKKKPPPGFVPWNEDTFRRLVERPPEPLTSRFAVSHGLLLAVLRRPGGADYAEVIRLVDRSHETPASKARERRRAAALFRSLVRAGVVEVVDVGFPPPEVRVHADLQTDFALHDTLSLYLVEVARALDPDAPDHALDLLSAVEALQEDPRPILAEQTRRARGERVARLKAEGVDYEERMRRLEEVTHPRPLEDFLRESFRLFAAGHPWAREEQVRPKSIARDLVERAAGFRDYVREYGLARSEGLLLRYLSQVHNTLVKTVPDTAKTDAVTELIATLRVTVAGVDTSLLEAWEGLVRPSEAAAGPEAPAPRFDLATQERALAARARQELLAVVRALARRDYEEAASGVRQDADDPWDAARFEAALAPFHEEYGEVLFTPEARRAHHARLVASGPRTWDVTQVLLDAAGDGLWALHGEIDLRDERDPPGPLVRPLRIGP